MRAWTCSEVVLLRVRVRLRQCSAGVASALPVTSLLASLCSSYNTNISTFERKALVLKVFSRISKDRTTILEIFLNYDAKADVMSSASGLLERIVDAMVKVTQAKGQDLKLKHSALESLQAVLACINKFVVDYRRMSDKQEADEESARTRLAATKAAAAAAASALSPHVRTAAVVESEVASVPIAPANGDEVSVRLRARASACVRVVAVHVCVCLCLCLRLCLVDSTTSLNHVCVRRRC
jgi:hypothetical protein